MWHPPEFGFDGLARSSRLPRQSTPPSRSARSKLTVDSPRSEARRPSGGPPPSLDLVKLATRVPQAFPRRPGSAASPLATRGRSSPKHVEDFQWTGFRSASQCLAEELRPSTPPKTPLRSNLRRRPSPHKVYQVELPMPRGGGRDDWEITPSDSADLAGSAVSTAVASPPKAAFGAGPVNLPPEEEDQERDGRWGRCSVSFHSLNSCPNVADRARAQTNESYFAEVVQPGELRIEVDVPVPRRRSIATTTGSGGRFSKRSSVALNDVLEADVFSPSLRLSREASLAETEAPDHESQDEGDEAETSFSEGFEEEIRSVLHLRRGGVSAEAKGAWNHFTSSKSWPSKEKSTQQAKGLKKVMRSDKCPFTQQVGHATLDSLVDAMEVQEFRPGQQVCQQDAQGDCAYVILSGSVSVFKERAHEERIFVRSLGAGSFFGEGSMLWRTPRTRSVYMDERGPATLGILYREAYHDLVVRSEIKERSRREDYLRRAPVLETLSDEQIAQIADALQTEQYDPDEDIVTQGERGDKLYVILEGTCVVTVKTGTAGDIDIQEHRRIHAGDMFGEKALLENTRRSASVTAVTHVEVLFLKRAAFERMLGPLSQLQRMHYLSDPRRSIANFYQPGDESGPAGVCGPTAAGGDTQWFAVYRPTSRDAIAKMLSGAAVGKGLNVKGKSAKLNRLSGFVPFLQISQENDKAEVAPSPSDACVTIYFASDELRSRAASQLQSLLDSADLHVQEDHLIALDDYPNTPGLILPEPLLHYAFIDKPDIQPAVGWETGRISSPAFMDMNLQALRGDSKPKVVLYQFDQDNAMNPHGLLIAYAEATVKPVVSDFDTFTVGSRGMTYKRLHPEQADLAMWALKHTEQLLRKPSLSSWTSRWLEVLKEAHDEGFHPDIPEYGFGDETSYKLIEGIVEATSESGAVRHGAECFNFYFPQELDDNYLVVWEGFDDKPWAYMDEDALRDFLEERVEEDYAMPLNPVWCVRDQGWYDVLEAQISNDACKKIMEAWYPEGSGILEKIEELHKEFPNGFQTGLPPGEEGRRPTLRSTLSTVNDLDTTEKAILASSMAKSGRSRWGEAIRKVHLMQSMSRHSLMPRSVSPA